jgi:hypothetical protein
LIQQKFEHGGFNKMYPKIGSAPTTDPQWVDKKLMNTGDLSQGEVQISVKQTEIMKKTQSILNQTVLKGDTKAAQAQERALKEQFQNLSTEEKQFMYNILNSKNATAEKFQYRLATAQRERLFKVLNPDHITSPQATEKMKASAKADKAGELKSGEISRQRELNQKM